MASSTLYIPKTLVVGFQTRSDTFTGKLAYVIYKDHTGRLRKEASWNGWRDHKIETLEIENVPTPNFTLNKGVQRSREWFGTGRSMVRVWDPRDFEFEITVDNLLNVLMHADVSKRDITEPCVYAWQGTNLVLLPTNSVEYQESLKHTEKQSVKTSAKDLVAGHTYSVKKDSTTRVVYLGRFDRFEVEHDYKTGTQLTKQKPKKYHVFIDEETKEVFAREPSALIAACVSDEVHPEYASLMDYYYASAESQPVIGLTTVTDLNRYGRHGLWVPVAGEFVQVAFHENSRPLPKQPGELYTQYEYFTTASVDTFAVYDDEKKAMRRSYSERPNYGYFSYSDRNPIVHYPGKLRKDSPEVLAIVARAQELADKYKYDRVAHGYNYEMQRQLDNQRAEVLHAEFNSGNLAFVLADGKTARDHQL